jgi:phenazine biosynthesis protein phzE
VPSLFQRILREPTAVPFALLVREHLGTFEVLTGDVVDVATLAEIPLHRRDPDSGAVVAQEVLSLVPYRTVRERGYRALDDGAPLRCLIVTERQELELAEALRLLPDTVVPLGPGAFDITDEAYARIVEQVIDQEIGRGEGANFVISRSYEARCTMEPAAAALAWMRALLVGERGAHWTFAVSTPGHVAVGATPESHVSVQDEVVTMNPISGTFRHGPGGATREEFLEFLSNGKETEELFMVVDEELKMMSAVCRTGGAIHGPYLKPMSRVTHTEYLLRGRSRLDPRKILRETMFAPTVTGSPIENACRVIERYERRPRGYYSAVAALFTPEAAGGHNLDAPLLIRTAYLQDGVLRVPAGATLVRHSDPASEVAETTAKASGLLTALGAMPAPAGSSAHMAQMVHEPAIQAALAGRNEALSPFWLHTQQPASTAPFTGLTAAVIDAEDRFTTMLAHLLRHLGMTVDVHPWFDARDATAGHEADLLVAGPGPGDPTDHRTPRIATMHRIVTDRLETGRPLLAVCLSHQILAHRMGLAIERLRHPRQGTQLGIDLFGTPARLGYYNTFTARRAPGQQLPPGVEAAIDSATGDVHALRGPGFASVQGHIESVLSRDGLDALTVLVSMATATLARS